jgi:ABC-type transport system involved in multi-copper enzyme maturation permease subunit
MKILGPVFWYDLIRVARRQRLALWRALYASALLVALYLLYATTFPQAGLLSGTEVGRNQLGELAAFATYFFAVFAALQFAAVVILTPALTAGALAEERSHNTLVFLLTTHLTNREIVLGKLVTRLLLVGLLVLTGLPVLGLMQLFGGVDQLLVLAAFIGVFVTALSLGALGVACAVFVKKPQNAAWRAYQWLILYAILSTVTAWLFDLPTAKAAVGRFRWMAVARPGGPVFARGPWTPPQTTTQDVMETVCAANPYYAAQRIYYEMMADVPVTEVVPPVVRDYVVFHGVIAAVCVGLAVWRLRAVAARQISGLTVKRAVVLKPAPHPPVQDRPVLWKEIYCETKPRQRWLALFFSRWFFAASFLPTWVLMVFGMDHFDRLTGWFHLALVFGGTLVAGILLLRVGAHAARSIGSERDRQTLDSLLTTLLRPDEIIRDKWWGSLFAGRWVFVWLLVHWGLGLLAMAVHVLAVPFLIAEVAVYGAFMVSLGLYCSTRYRSTKQATTAALVIGLFGTTAVPWMAGQFLMTALPPAWYQTPRAPAPAWRYAQSSRTWPEKVALGLTTVRVLFESVVPNYDVWSHYTPFGAGREWTTEVAPPAVWSLLVYGALAWGLRRRAMVRFRHSYGVPARLARRPDLRRVRAREPAVPIAPAAGESG